MGFEEEVSHVAVFRGDGGNRGGSRGEILILGSRTPCKDLLGKVTLP